MTNNFENENNEEFVEAENGAPEEKARRSGMAGNLSEAWRTRPMFKFMVLIVAVFAVGVAAMNFLGGESGNEVARLGKPPNLHEAPGGALSPYMKQQTELANSERSAQAIASGGSAIPTPIGQATDVGSLGVEDKKDDPLKELRAETENLKKQIQQQQVQQQQQQVQMQQQVQQKPKEQFDESMAQAMQRQMQQLLEGWTPKGIKNVAVIKAEDLKIEQDKAAQVSAAANTATAAAVNPQKILVNAGTVSYAQLLTEANSDVPGPILAQIVSGPLAGARAIGGFQVSEGYEKYLVLRFSLADRKGRDYRIDAVALDPDTTLGGLATEVDERYFVRVVLPAAAGFLQGLGQELGQGNSSITTNGTTSISTISGNGIKYGMYNGMGVAAQTAGQFFQNQANLTKPLVRVAANTPIGMFFVSPVLDATIDETPTGQNANNGGGAPNGGYNHVGYNANYPGTTVNGYGNGQQNSGMPYPNYATPGAGYRSSMPGFGGMPASPYTQNYGQ